MSNHDTERINCRTFDVKFIIICYRIKIAGSKCPANKFFSCIILEWLLTLLGIQLSLYYGVLLLVPFSSGGGDNSGKGATIGGHTVVV